MSDKVKTSSDSVSETTTNTNGFFSIQNLIAFLVLVAYGFFIYFLIGKVDNDDPSWSRLIYLFSGVEAIVFAAVGFLFGKEVNRRRAEQAETEKKEAAEKMEKAKEEKVEEHNKGLVLGAMIMQAEDGQKIPTTADRGLEMSIPTNSLHGIAEKAKKLYPELNK